MSGTGQQCDCLGLLSMKAGGERETVVYIGGVVDESIVRERGLLSHNAAGSNRMIRIGHALARAGYAPVLLSPAASLRARGCGSRYCGPKVRRIGALPVVYAAMIGITGLNVLLSPLFQLLALRRILSKRRVVGVVIYNFNPSLVLLTAYARWGRGLRVLHNVEDVSVPKWKDWLPQRRARPLQQLVFWGCMRLIAGMAQGCFVPTRKFLEYLPNRGCRSVITGCIEVRRERDIWQKSPVRILYAGKIEEEHGIREFVSALRLLDGDETMETIEVDVSGPGELTGWVRDEFANLTRIRAMCHGFVAKARFDDMLERAHICVALQDPKGRYADLKTPSKVYEFLGHGKAVIATAVGDIEELGEDMIRVLPELRAELLAEAILELVSDMTVTSRRGKAAWQFAKAHYSYEAVGEMLRQMLEGDPRSCS